MLEKERKNVLRGLKIRKLKLEEKIKYATKEIEAYRRNYRVWGHKKSIKVYAGGLQKHWMKMAKRSLMASRKKMYALELRMKYL